MESELLSIGRLASAVGVTPDTLRIWERRYGAPVPVRLPSGHRRYPRREVHRLRLVTELLARGRRPRAVVPLPTEELEGLLGATPEQDLANPEVAAWIGSARALRREELATSMLAVAQRTTPIEFLEDHVSPFLRRVGSEWAAGGLDIRNEHFATEVLMEVLHSLRQRSVSRLAPDAPGFVLAALPGETHELGLLMVAYLLDLLSCEVHNLGSDVPVEEIAATARETGAAYVGLSISVANAGPATDRQVTRLHGLMPETTELIVGGAGSRNVRRRLPQARAFPDLRGFQEWAEREFEPAPRGNGSTNFFGGRG